MHLGISSHSTFALYHEPDGLSIMTAADLLLFPALFPANPVNMPLKITAGDQFRQHELFEGGTGAGLKAQFFLKFRNQMPGQHHVAHPKSGRNSLGKAV